jgi:hypothetical protein
VRFFPVQRSGDDCPYFFDRVGHGFLAVRTPDPDQMKQGVQLPCHQSPE